MKNFLMYNLMNEKGEEETLFFPPRSEDSKIKQELDHYKNCGYIITGVLKLDKEDYLNARLNCYVKEYCQLDLDEKRFKKTVTNTSLEVIFSTLELMQQNKETKAKQIGMAIRRLINCGFSINNELAIAIYNHNYLDFKNVV